jgi:hypothetical protein
LSMAASRTHVMKNCGARTAVIRIDQRMIEASSSPEI